MKNALEIVFPKETKFFDLLYEQATNVSVMHQKFTEFLDRYEKLKPGEKVQMVKKIKELESLGDKMLSLILSELESAFITPLDRDDIHRLAMKTDDVADAIYHMSKRMVLFKVRRVPPQFPRINKTIGQQLSILSQIMGGLKTNGKDTALQCIKIQSLENEAEDQIDEGLAKVLSSKMPADELLKLKDLYDTMKLITTNAEDVTYLLQNIEVKHG